MSFRVLFALPGMHLVARGAEAALENIARELSVLGHEVTLVGAGEPREGEPYRFIHAGMTDRERFRRWPSIPPMRSEYRWEELTFAPRLWRSYRPKHVDVTITCSYPFVNWILRAKRPRVPHVFVTENGDWPAHAGRAEYRWFGCEGLVCTNPEYYNRNKGRWNCALIPNGVDIGRFTPGEGTRQAFGVPVDVPVVGMVSALIPSKHVMEGIRAVARLPDAHLLLAGDGPLHAECDQLGASLLGSRYHRLTVTPPQMPDLYRSMTILLHLSREEAFGNIYIEAAACGLPVLAHQYPVTEWILGERGILVDTSDPEKLDKALRDALDIRARFPSADQYEAIASRFAWPVIAGQYSDFLQRILDGPRS